MEKIIKFPKEIHEDLPVSPWENTPSRHSAHPCHRPKVSKDVSISMPVSPYRPRTFQQKSVARRYSTIVQDITFSTPARSKEFPKRSYKCTGRFTKEINRSRSCCSQEGISISELEHIERVQQLIPYKPPLLVNMSRKTDRASLGSMKKGQIFGSGIVKESTFTSTFYKKFNKYDN